MALAELKWFFNCFYAIKMQFDYKNCIKLNTLYFKGSRDIKQFEYVAFLYPFYNPVGVLSLLKKSM